MKGRKDIVEAVELGYPLSEMEEEIANLFSDEEERRRMSDLVTGAVDEALTEREDATRRMSSRKRHSESHTGREAPSEYSSSGDLLTLSKEAYTDLLQRLGFYDVRVGRTLKHPESIPSIYFNSRYGFVYFVAYVKGQAVLSSKPVETDHPSKTEGQPGQSHHDSFPGLDREREAFEELLAGDVAFEATLPQVQEPAPRVMVNDYRKRKSQVHGEMARRSAELFTSRPADTFLIILVGGGVDSIP